MNSRRSFLQLISLLPLADALRRLWEALRPSKPRVPPEIVRQFDYYYDVGPDSIGAPVQTAIVQSHFDGAGVWCGESIVTVNGRDIEPPIPMKRGDELACISLPGCIGVFLNGKRIG